MKVIKKSIDSLKEYKNNPRQSKKAIRALVNSINDFGFKVPIIIDKNDVIIAGHTRLVAAKQLGLEEVPCIIADDLNEEQIKAFRLIDNRTSEFSKWNNEKLENEYLSGIGRLERYGFNEQELEFYSSKIKVDDFFTEEIDESKEQKPLTKFNCPYCGEEFFE